MQMGVGREVERIWNQRPRNEKPQNMWNTSWLEPGLIGLTEQVKFATYPKAMGNLKSFQWGWSQGTG